MKFKDTPEAKPCEYAYRLGVLSGFLDANEEVLYRAYGNSVITLIEELYKAAEAIKLCDAEFEDVKKRYPKLKKTEGPRGVGEVSNLEKEIQKVLDIMSEDIKTLIKETPLSDPIEINMGYLMRRVASNLALIQSVVNMLEKKMEKQKQKEEELEK